MRLNLRRLLLGVFVAVVVSAGTAWAGGSEVRDKPIIADLMHDTRSYDGKAITVYGLVIGARKGGREFFIQDVSQMPLRVVGRRDVTAQVGDELLLIGTFHASQGDPFLEARSHLHTKVVGGGCC